MRKSILAAVTVALALTVSSPAPAQEENLQGARGYGPDGYPKPFPDGPAPCQYEPEVCDGSSQYAQPYIPSPGEPEGAPDIDGPADAPNIGAGDGPIEAANGDPDAAASLNGAIEAARADRSGGVPPTAAELVEEDTADIEGTAPATGTGAYAEGGVEQAAVGGEAKDDVDVEEGAAGGESGDEDRATGSGGAEVARAGGSAESTVLSDANAAPPLVLLGAGSVLLLGAGLLLRRLVR